MSEPRAAAPAGARGFIPKAYRPALLDPTLQRLMPAFFLWTLGTGMSAIAIAWLALEIAPEGQRGLVVGAAVAAYELPGLVGGFALGRFLSGWSARRSSSRWYAQNRGEVPERAPEDALEPPPAAECEQEAVARRCALDRRGERDR